MQYKLRIAALYVIYNEEDYIEYSLRSVYEEMDEIVICLTTGRPWFGSPRKPDQTRNLIEGFPDYNKKITLITGEWASEPIQRQAALEAVKSRCTHCLIIDGDEIYKQAHLRALKEIASRYPEIGQLAVGMNTYWKSPLWRIDPPEPYTPIVISRVTKTTEFVHLRATNETPIALVNRSSAILYHFSYAKSTDKIKSKIENFSHANEIVPDWFEKVWLSWDANPLLENLHPTHPECYKRTIYEEKKYLPQVMWDHPFVISNRIITKRPKQ
jgi:hypothetical protein